MLLGDIGPIILHPIWSSPAAAMSGRYLGPVSFMEKRSALPRLHTPKTRGWLAESLTRGGNTVWDGLIEGTSHSISSCCQFKCMREWVERSLISCLSTTGEFRFREIG